MKKATMVATSIIVVVIFFSFCAFGADPTNNELGKGMLKIGTEIGKIKIDVGNLKKQPSGIDESRVSQIINQQAVTMDGKTLKDLKVADAETAKKAGEALTKSQEALTKVNNFKVNFNSPEAQLAIQTWVEKNMFGGRSIVQVMGKDKDGKIRADAVAILNETYASKSEVIGLKTDLTKTQTDVSGLSTEMIKISLDVANVMTAFEWQEAFDRDGKSLGKVIKSIKLDKLPQEVKTAVGDAGELMAMAPKDKDGKLVQVASQKDLEQKADVTYVDTEIARVENNTADNLDNLRALALKKDKALVFVYASYMLKQDETGFREWLRPQIDEKDLDKKFNEIKSKAEEARTKKIVKF